MTKRLTLVLFFILQNIIIANAQEDKRLGILAGISYSPTIASVDGEQFTKDPIHGYSIDLQFSYNVCKKLPLDVFTGFKLGNGNKSTTNDNDKDWKTKFNLMNIDIPVGVQYRIKINDKVNIIPNVALNMRIGCSAWEKTEYTGGLSGKKYKDKYGSQPKLSTFDCYKSNKEGDQWKRFELGMRVGVNVSYERFFFGYAFAPDFVGPTENIKINTHLISVGLRY